MVRVRVRVRVRVSNKDYAWAFFPRGACTTWPEASIGVRVRFRVRVRVIFPHPLRWMLLAI